MGIYSGRLDVHNESPRSQRWNVPGILEIYKQKWVELVAVAQGTDPLGLTPESDSTTNLNINSHNIMMTFSYVIALVAHQLDVLSILDWGGGIGHYYKVAQALLPGVQIDYHCKEVPILAEYRGAATAGSGFLHR